MPFHRLTTPTYFGGLVGGQDYLNTPSDPSVGGSGVPALVDPIKSGGPNDGTYFCAFREDGRSEFVNRGLFAIGQNTDTLDDILRTSIPSVTFADATAAGAVTTVALVGEIWVGENGTANTQANRDKIVRVTDQNNNDLEVSGAKIVAVLIHDGAAANVVGTQLSGFRTNASVNFTPSIPNTTTYRVWYGVRNNFANISATAKGALFREQLRTINNVPGEVRSLLRQVHSEVSVNQAWDAAFDSTIRSLAAAGLNERYRRARLQPAGFVTGDFDSAGSGAVINRDGRAVEIQADTNMLTQNVGWKDGNHALLKLGLEDARSASSSSITGNTGGDFGVWHESEWRPSNTGDAGMFSRGESAGPVLLDVIPYDMRAATFDGDTLFTYIDASSATATTNPEGSGTSFSVDCGPGQYFCLTAPTRTAIRVGIDMVEITDSNDLVRTFYIASIVSATRITVVGPAGTTASPFQLGTDAGCKIRIIQTTVSVGGWLGTPASMFRRPLFVMPPAILTTVVANEDIPGCAFFGSQTGSVTDATAQARRARALEFGGTASPDSGGTVNGAITARGWLNGDGSIHGTKLNITGAGAFGGALTVTGDLTVNDDLTVAQDATIGDDLVIGSDLDVANETTTTYLVVERPELYYVLDEEFLNVNQNFTPDLIHTTDHTWTFDEISGVFTVNNGTNSQKNPGQMELIGSGGGVVRALSIRTTSLNHFAFAGLQSMTVIMAVIDDPANILTNCSVAIRSSAGGGGTNVLGVGYFNGLGWCVHHVAGGVSGAHNFAVLGAQVNDQFVVMRLLRNALNGIDIYFNGTLILTVTAAQMPSGLGSLAIVAEQGGGDNDPCFFTMDRVYVRQLTNANRAGA
jgi:hypothetical protein